ncbi:MAG: hypothetical protein M2R45_00699 [Verrucomicrobia subdivision 3 bacterium]|nr:hypothetical protein [Limisphaerales bacterium]MCS1414417.1 hypothetical protein [Limisphaerales bacterium]
MIFVRIHVRHAKKWARCDLCEGIFENGCELMESGLKHEIFLFSCFIDGL